MAVPLSDLVGPTTARDVEGMAGNLLKIARAKSGLSQRAVADRAGVPHSTVQRIESGAQQPSLPMLFTLISAAGMELRARVDEADRHDEVLDRRAERNPALHAALVEGRDRFFERIGS